MRLAVDKEKPPAGGFIVFMLKGIKHTSL